MNMKYENGKWYINDGSIIVASARRHGSGWIVSGNDENGQPFETWAINETRAKKLLKKHTGYAPTRTP